MELMRREIEQPNSEVFIETLKRGQEIELQEGVFKGQLAMVEYLSNKKTHLFLPSLGIKLVISSTQPLPKDRE